jgi:hypothetical protein
VRYFVSLLEAELDVAREETMTRSIPRQSGSCSGNCIGSGAAIQVRTTARFLHDNYIDGPVSIICRQRRKRAEDIQRGRIRVRQDIVQTRCHRERRSSGHTVVSRTLFKKGPEGWIHVPGRCIELDNAVDDVVDLSARNVEVLDI